MEASALLLATLIACIAVMIVLWARNREKNHNLFKRYGIPGPEPSFWWGNLKDMKCKPTKNETITAWLKKYGDVFGYFLGEVPFVVVKDLEMLKQVQHYLHDAHTSSTDYEFMFPAVACIKKVLNKFKTAKEMTDLVVSSVSKAITERSKNPEIKSMDFLQLMLDRRENNEIAASLSNQDILHNVFLFILGGYESSSISLAFTFYLLAEHPEIQEKLYEEIKKANDDNYITVQNLPYLNQVLMESLRLYPPLTGFITRECSEDYQVGSVTIPKGAIVEAPVWDIHHDPDLWPDPWKFDPDRFSPENKASLNTMAYMAFGIGRRNCIAEKFALAEAKLAIFRLVKKFQFEACDKTNGLLSLICRSVMTFPAAGINLRAVPRTATLYTLLFKSKINSESIAGKHSIGIMTMIGGAYDAERVVDITVSVVRKKAGNKEMFDMSELTQGLTIDVIAGCTFAMKTNCQENPHDTLLNSVRGAFRVARNKALFYTLLCFHLYMTTWLFSTNIQLLEKMNALIMDSVSKAITERHKNRQAKRLDLLQLMLEHSEAQRFS
ncbi:Cytochrome P450 3A12 like protein [Argiope bruennichi]|uniref:Cytochrome P450 3A12 like protein n=1 Tax=Argiope bruennichi TaxID=94029 RepID=A0A8T0EUV5_ARGBR|nr:Cytochrome P450 3A12 like protein [Argiope bruennichi]